MAITDEHRKSAEKSMRDIFSMKGLTPKEKNQLFKEAMDKRRAAVAKNTPEYFTKDEIAKGRMTGESARDFRKRIKPFVHPKASFLEGTDPYSQDINVKTPGQKEQIEELLNVLKGKWEPLLKDMAKSPRTAMNQQIEDWFSHMNNPIVQSMIGQGYRTNPQVLFPSELGQSDSSNQLNALLSGLGQQFGPGMTQYGFDKAAEYLPQAYDSAMGMAGQMGQYGQQMGGGLMDMLSALGNRFRSPQQPQG